MIGKNRPNYGAIGAAATTHNTGNKTPMRLASAVAALAIVGGSFVVFNPEANAVSVGDSVYTSEQVDGFDILGSFVGGQKKAGTSLFGVETENGVALAYCIEEERLVRLDQTYGDAAITATVGTVDSYPTNNAYKNDPAVRDRVNWIIANSYPSVSLATMERRLGMPASTLSEKSAIAQTQAAIWEIINPTDDYAGLIANYDGVPPSPTDILYSDTLYNYLVDNSVKGLNASTTAVVTVTSQPAAGETVTVNGAEFVALGSFESSDKSNILVHSPVDLYDAQGNLIDTSKVPSGQMLYTKSADAGAVITAVTQDGDNGQIIVTSAKINQISTGLKYSGPGQTMLTAYNSGKESTASLTANTPAPVTTTPATETTTPATETTTPAVETTTPAVETTTPAVEMTTPAVETTTPAVETTTPAVETTTPADSTTPAVETTTPAVETTTPAVETTTPVVETTTTAPVTTEPTTPVVETTTPAVETTTPADSTTPVVETTTPVVSTTPRTPVELGTTATDAADGDHFVDFTQGQTAADATKTVVDRVTYTGLEVGKVYKVEGELMKKLADGTVEGTGVTAWTVFTAQTTDGFVDVNFEVPAFLAGTALVAFEQMSTVTLDVNGQPVDGNGDNVPDSETPVGEHKDPSDENQTVYVGKLATTATEGGDQTMTTAGGTIVDHVVYEGLKPNTEYTINGTLMIKETGEAAGVESLPMTFTTDASGTGSVDINFEVAASIITAYADAHNGELPTFVVFEYASTAKVDENGTPVVDGNGNTEMVPVAEHADINDVKQSVVVTETTPSTTPVVETTTPAVETTTPAVETTTPVAETTTPAVETTTPPAEPTHPVDPTTTPVDSTTPVVETTTPVVETTTPVVETTTPAVETTTPVVETTTPVVSTTPRVPGDVQQLGTTATDKTDGDHFVDFTQDQTAANASKTVTDAVTYTGLNAGELYKMVGELVVKNADGTTTPTGITSWATFTPAESAGTVNLDFEVPASWAGNSLVAFESLFTVTVDANGNPVDGNGDNVPDNGELVGEHQNPNDENQTVYVGKLATTATEGGDQTMTTAGGTIVDHVVYEGLKPNTEYTINGTLMIKETGEAAGVESLPMTFTTDASGTGSVDINFAVPASVITNYMQAHGGQLPTFVVFEYASTAKVDENGNPVVDANGNTVLVPVAEHADINDVKQSVVVVEETPTDNNGTDVTVGTTATDAADGDHNVVAGGSVVVDRISYTGLEAGKYYTVRGELMDKATGAATGITAWKTFKAEAANGFVDVRFEVPAGYAGKDLVAFEYLHVAKLNTDGTPVVGENGKNEGVSGETAPVEGQPVIGEHTDITDGSQTVSVINDIRTTATDAADGDKVLVNGGTIVDNVDYRGLIAGQDYILQGTLMDKTTGQPVIDAVTGKPVVAVKNFTAATADGQVSIEFVLNAETAKAYAGKELVVFEQLSEVVKQDVNGDGIPENFDGREVKDIVDGNGNTVTVVVVARHEDINDAAQTVFNGPKDETPTDFGGNETPGTVNGSASNGSASNTTDGSSAENVWPWIVGGAATAGIVGGIINHLPTDFGGVEVPGSSTPNKPAQPDGSSNTPAQSAGSTTVNNTTVNNGPVVNGNVNTPAQGGKTTTHAAKSGSKSGALANTGASVLGLAGFALAVMAAGLALILRRKNA